MAKIKAYELINKNDLRSGDAFLIETDDGTHTIDALNLLSGIMEYREINTDTLDGCITEGVLYKSPKYSVLFVKDRNDSSKASQIRINAEGGAIATRVSTAMPGGAYAWGSWTQVCTLSDVYTKQETDTAIAAVAGLNFAVVSELPDPSQASPNTVYLTPVSGQANVYNQHICINNAWYDLGTNNIDLSGKADVDSVYSKEDADDKFATKAALNDKANANDVYSKEVADAKFALKRTSMGLAPVITTGFLPDTDVIPIGQVYIFDNRGYIRSSDDPLPTRHQRMLSIDDLNEVWDTTDALENDLRQKMSYAKHTNNIPISDLVNGQGFYSDDTIGFKTTGSNSKEAYTTDYIDDALADVENVVEVLDNALDTAVDTKTLYLHRVTSGSSTYIKGTVICAGSNYGYTQFRFRRSGGIEYRTGAGNPISWGNYTATGNWIKLATMSDIPTVDAALSSSSENPVQNKVVKAAIDGISQVPSGGTTGQVLTKMANGYAWQDLPLYNGGVQ